MIAHNSRMAENSKYIFRCAHSGAILPDEEFEAAPEGLVTDYGTIPWWWILRSLNGLVSDGAFEKYEGSRTALGEPIPCLQVGFDNVGIDVDCKTITWDHVFYHLAGMTNNVRVESENETVVDEKLFSERFAEFARRRETGQQLT